MPPHPPNCQCGDDDAHVILEGVQDFLYDKIDKDRVVALNGEEGKQGKIVIKPWDLNADEVSYLESDADDQLILQIPFTGSIKLRSVLIRTGPSDKAAEKVQLFVNQSLDFDEATSAPCTQELSVALSNDTVEYPVNTGGDNTRIYFVGFKGEFSAFTRDPVITVYEKSANPADHPKIPGIGDNVQSRIG